MCQLRCGAPAILAYSALAAIFITWCVAVIGVGEALRRRVTASLKRPGTTTDPSPRASSAETRR